MLFLVELDHVQSGVPLTPEAGRAFVEQVIFPTLAQAERLAAEEKIVGGGPVVGRIALRLLVEAESTAQLDGIVSSLPLWPLAETRVTPLTGWRERREGVQRLLERLASAASQ